MTDTTGEAGATAGSAESVAYQMLRDIAFAERRDYRGLPAGENRVSKGWILNTYRECLAAVRGESD